MSSRLAIIAAALLAAAPVAGQFNRSPERQAATEKDYHETLARLGITRMRPGADGYNKDSPNYVNYDEARAGPSSPAPPIITVAHPTATWWWRVRRPQLVRLLEDEMYGRVPVTAPKIEWRLVSEQHLRKFDTPVIERDYRGTAKGSSLAIDLSEALPEAADHVPLVLELGFPEGFRFPGMPAPTDPWQGQVLRRGWAYAIIVRKRSKPTTARVSRKVSSESRPAASRARCTTGARCVHGRGARAAPSICSSGSRK